MTWPVRFGHAGIFVLVFLAACGRGGDSAPETSPTSTTTTEIAPTPQSCEELASDIVDTLQRYVDQFAGMTVEGLAGSEAPLAPVDLEAQARSFRERGEALACDPLLLEDLLAGELERLHGEGPIAEAIAATFSSQILDTPDPSDRPPEALRLAPGEDLAAAVAGVGSGSTILLEPGEYRLQEPLLILRPLALVGSGRDETRIASRAEGAAIIYLGEGKLSVQDLTLTHEGESPASVLVIRSGSSRIRDVRISGAVQAPDGAGGIGVVLASPEQLGGTGSPSAGPTTEIENSEFVTNAGAGIAVTGRNAPIITASLIHDNGVCGICFLGEAGGTLRGNLITSNDAGVVVEDAARPLIEHNEITANPETGLLYRGEGGGVVRGNVIADNGAAGIFIADGAEPKVDGNVVRNHELVGIAIAGRSEATVTENRIEGNAVGIEVSGTAAPAVERNDIQESGEIGIRVGERSEGVITGNTVSGDVPVGMLVTDEARPLVKGNILTNIGAVGLLYLGDAAGRALANQMQGQEIGIQVGEAARPELAGNTVSGEVPVGILVTDEARPLVEGNTLDNRGDGGLVYLGQAGGQARDNRISGQEIGIQVGEAARPELAGNTMRGHEGAAVLYAGASRGRADGNTCQESTFGIVLLEDSDPVLTDNQCQVHDQRG